MTHSHTGKSDDGESLPSPAVLRRALGAVLVVLVALTIAAAVPLWPTGKNRSIGNINAGSRLVEGTVANPDAGRCVQQSQDPTCYLLSVRVTQGPEAGSLQNLELNKTPGNPAFERGQKLVLDRTAQPDAPEPIYSFADFNRKPDLSYLAVTFAILVVLVGRWRGLGAIVGLAFTALVLVKFMLPSILEGNSPIAVALVASSMIILVVLYVAHGFNVRTTTAIIGTLVSLSLVALLSAMVNVTADLTGITSDETTYIQQVAGGAVNLDALLIAGFIIGSLGVLNDTTVTQASAVWEIHSAEPSRPFKAIYESGMRVGRDHIASTVYTLVLAYVGTALPITLLFTVSQESLGNILNGEIVAEEVIRILVGAIGLIASVPITTALAAFLVRIGEDNTSQNARSATPRSRANVDRLARSRLPMDHEAVGSARYHEPPQREERPPPQHFRNEDG